MLQFFVVVVFYALSALRSVFFFYEKAKLTIPDDPQFSAFQRTYLLVYLLAIAGDWLQGPHVYALYEFYGMSKHDIELLFLAGFGSSMLFGTFAGSIADKYGRRNNCFLYGVLYGLGCITKHFPDFRILFLGRILAGTATSFLWSAFESWLVYEHSARGFSDSQLSTLLSHATLGNSLVAILCGLVAEIAAKFYGFVAPFDCAMIVLGVMSFVVLRNWTENYGDQSAPVHRSFTLAANLIFQDTKLIYLGLIQALFEGSMYVFVLEWTPALGNAVKASEAKGGEKSSPLPHGYIFASFMVAVMIGSFFFKLLTRFSRVESFMRYVLFLSAICLGTSVAFSKWPTIVFSSFIVFECCIGIYWPSLSYLRSIYIPESARATVMNFYRVPLNLIVVAVLLEDLPLDYIFQSCVVMLLIATACQHLLFRIADTEKDKMVLHSTCNHQVVVQTESEDENHLTTDEKTFSDRNGAVHHIRQHLTATL